MAISNTSILIKRSSSTTNPGTLKSGELAYSYVSNTLYFGTVGGNGTMNIGGVYYTQAIDSATSANVASTIVKRDVNGGFSGNLTGTSSNTYALVNGRNFSISGGDITASAQSFNGTSDITLSASLNSVAGLSAGYYGGSTAGSTVIPVLNVAANGRIMSISNTTSSSSFTVSDGANSNTVYSGSTLTFKGNNNSGITTFVGGDEKVYFGVDSTIVRSNTTGSTQSISTDLILPANNLTVGGTITAQNLAISGNITYSNVISTLNVTDPIIYLASNNSSNLVDIGMVGHFVGTGHTGDTSHYQHTGFVRDYTDNKWKLFSNVSIEPTTTVTFDANTNYDVIKVGGVDVAGGAINSKDLSLTGNLSVGGTTTMTGQANTTADLGVGGNFYVTGNETITGTTRMVGNANTTNNLGVGGTFYAAGATELGNNLKVDGTTTLVGQANTTNDFGVGGNSYITGDETVSGKFSVTGQANTTNDMGVGGNLYVTGSIRAGSISFASPITVPNGGTGNSAFTVGSILIGNGTGALTTLPNTTFVATGSGASNNTISSVTVDAYGRFTSATYSQILGLTVPQGGTGVSSFTANGIVFGNGSGAMQATSMAGSADQTWSNQILTVTNAGVPVWSSALDGGTF
jgi:hypothetical protein